MSDWARVDCRQPTIKAKKDSSSLSLRTMCDPENDGCYSEAVVVCAALPRRQYENTPGPLLKSCFYSSNNRSSIANGYVGRRHIGGINSKKNLFLFFFFFQKCWRPSIRFETQRVCIHLLASGFFFLLSGSRTRTTGRNEGRGKKKKRAFSFSTCT